MTPKDIPTPETDAASWQQYDEFLFCQREIVSAEACRSLERRLHVAKAVLKTISKGYSGAVGNCQGLTGTDCAEIASESLKQLEEMKNV